MRRRDAETTGRRRGLPRQARAWSAVLLTAALALPPPGSGAAADDANASPGAPRVVEIAPICLSPDGCDGERPRASQSASRRADGVAPARPAERAVAERRDASASAEPRIDPAPGPPAPGRSEVPASAQGKAWSDARASASAGAPVRSDATASAQAKPRPDASAQAAARSEATASAQAPAPSPARPEVAPATASAPRQPRPPAEAQARPQASSPAAPSAAAVASTAPAPAAPRRIALHGQTMRLVAPGPATLAGLDVVGDAIVSLYLAEARTGTDADCQMERGAAMKRQNAPSIAGSGRWQVTVEVPAGSVQCATIAAGRGAMFQALLKGSR